MFAWMADPSGWAALVTLSAMEIVLGIDNVVFISVLVSRLPAAQAERARRIGLLLALVFRVLLLFTLTLILTLTQPVFTVLGHGVSWRDIILLAGGLFLIAKATHEIHAEIEGDENDHDAAVPGGMGLAILQIAVIDLVFSVDSIVTAIGMAQDISIMVTAVVIAMAVMYVAAGAVSGFISRHPTTKMLALSFLMLIGVSLVADGGGLHVPRGYIYSAMAFAAAVEAINIWAGRNRRRRRVAQR
ncbi:MULTISPECIES: TerC family protein [unclassified Chelatococcus]|uniref:TerC family protein n=1 Tax=unclassified Chelatococcus TaxID=2638111 RepID=UPI001BCF09FD|nr:MULTISPECIES: TerC family protein [unclassified Chelatococcus]MBS7695659.1 TerC family protein [Chelatococcus sp. YT9]MBX3557948.1 TerC family protein [Chelatococcus sp.]